VFCCGALSLLAYRVSSDGISVLTDDWRVWPRSPSSPSSEQATIRALLSLRTQLRATDRLGQHVRALELAACPKLEAAAASTSLSGRILLIDDERAFSFTFGLRYPRVAVSRGTG